MEHVCIMYILSLNYLCIYKCYYGASTMVKKGIKRGKLSNKYSTQNNKNGTCMHYVYFIFKLFMYI